MLQEAAHELVAGQAGGPPLYRLAILVAYGDGLVVETDNAAIGDGNAEHVAGEIAEHGPIAVLHGTAVHHPPLPPRSFRQDQIRTALCERGLELAAHKLGQGSGRNQETVARRKPMVAI